MNVRRAFLFLPLLLGAGIFYLFDQMIGHDPSELQLARKGQPVPAFSLPDLHQPDKMITAADLQGQPMLVNVWATWCPSCHVEHPYLLKLARENGVSIVGLNYKDEREAAKEWLARLEDPYIFSIYDEEGRLGLDLGVYGAPETYIVDANGIIRYRHVGVVDEKVWETVLSPIIASFDS